MNLKEFAFLLACESNTSELNLTLTKGSGNRNRSRFTKDLAHRMVTLIFCGPLPVDRLAAQENKLWPPLFWRDSETDEELASLLLGVDILYHFIIANHGYL